MPLRNSMITKARKKKKCWPTDRGKLELYWTGNRLSEEEKINPHPAEEKWERNLDSFFIYIWNEKKTKNSNFSPYGDAIFLTGGESNPFTLCWSVLYMTGGCIDGIVETNVRLIDIMYIYIHIYIYICMHICMYKDVNMHYITKYIRM